MPPPMATPKRTRGSRARKRISASELAAKIFCQARARSRRTGPSRAQAITESAKRISSTPLTKIIFLRSRTFTATSWVETALGFGEALRMHEAGDFLQSFADPRAGAQNLVGSIVIDTLFFHGRDGLEILPPLGGLFALRSHACFDDDSRRFCYDILSG